MFKRIPHGNFNGNKLLLWMHYKNNAYHHKRCYFIMFKDKKWFIDIANKLCEVTSDGEEKEQ